MSITREKEKNMGRTPLRERSALEKRPATQEPAQDTEPSAPAQSAAPEASAETASAGSTESAPAAPGKASWIKPIVFAVLGVAIVYGVIIGIRHFQFAAGHVSTDNATIIGDVVQIAPQVSGTIKDVRVKENQPVKKGDLLFVLDDATYKANVAQAQANLDAAIAQAKGAGVSVALTSETGNAQVSQAQGVVLQAESGISSATADVAKSAAGIATAKATAKGAEASVTNAQAAVNAAITSRERYADAVVSAQAQVETARAGVSAAQSAVEVAQSVYDKAAKDAERYAGLVREGAISEQTADAANASARQAKAQLEAAKQQVTSSQALVAQKQADLNAARRQVEWSADGIAQAKAQLAAAREQSNAAAAGIRQAQAQDAASRQMVHQAEARRAQALGQLHQAQTVPRQVAVSSSAEAQAQAKIEQARAALQAAQIQLDYTHVYAPQAGRISKKTAEIGALVQPGTPLMAIVPDETLWVVANFKETQLAGIQPGRSAEVEVDSLPGKSFKGHVESLSAATGATFSLLPPDNATGNFTKVVQRVPVKIVFEPDQPDREKLRAGLSVVVTVETR